MIGQFPAALIVAFQGLHTHAGGPPHKEVDEATGETLGRLNFNPQQAYT
jgi:hypothetical protein